MLSFKIEIPEYIDKILSSLTASGFDAYIVGGCVRDSFLNISVNDWDVCTSALPSEIACVLTDFNIIETGIEHGTVTAVSQGNMCEITTFRCEGSYSDHRHPDSVTFAKNIASDLSRRDFTINAMAYSPAEGLVDLFSGREDLDKKLIRCVGVAKERFDEDALRILRALRFSSCLGFEIEEETKLAIFKKFKLLKFVAKERITSELRRLLTGKNARNVMSEFKCVFEFIFEMEISSLPKAYEKTEMNLFISLAHLLFGLSAEKAFAVLKNLRFDNKTIRNVCFLLNNKDAPLNLEEKEALKLLSKLGREKLYLLSDFLLLDKSSAYKAFAEALPVLTLRELAITGEDILSAGIPFGKKIKACLDAALNAVLDGECENTKSSLLEFINRYASEQ